MFHRTGNLVQLFQNFGISRGGGFGGRRAPPPPPGGAAAPPTPNLSLRHSTGGTPGTAELEPHSFEMTSLSRVVGLRCCVDVTPCSLRGNTAKLRRHMLVPFSGRGCTFAGNPLIQNRNKCRCRDERASCNFCLLTRCAQVRHCNSVSGHA
jgi:hypothetical protein